jgi:hypothetical protein
MSPQLFNMMLNPVVMSISSKIEMPISAGTTCEETRKLVQNILPRNYTVSHYYEPSLSASRRAGNCYFEINRRLEGLL